MIVAVYPGTFDPMTLGHLDLLRRACSIFSRVIVAVAQSDKKKPLFTLAERVELARAQCADIPNASVEGFDGLLCNFVQRHGAQVLIRGARAVSDFEYEFQMAGMNRHLMPQVETIFLTPGADYQFVSGTFVREIALMGGDVSGFVSPLVAEAMRKKYEALKASS